MPGCNHRIFKQCDHCEGTACIVCDGQKCPTCGKFGTLNHVVSGVHDVSELPQNQSLKVQGRKDERDLLRRSGILPGS